MNTTYMAKAETIERKWYVVDAKDMTLGRLASEVAKILRGKHKPTYTPHVDTGDHVIIINAKDVKLTGKKLDQKYFRYHTGHPGGLKEVNIEILWQQNQKKLFQQLKVCFLKIA